MCQTAMPCRCAEGLQGAPSLTGRGNSQVLTAVTEGPCGGQRFPQQLHPALPALQSGCPPTAQTGSTRNAKPLSIQGF